MRRGTDYWSGHLATIEAEGITTRAYAEREGLAVGSLYEWRRRLKTDLETPTRLQRSGCFVPVRIRQASESMGCTLVIGAGTRLELSQLPSPDWLAALAAAVGERGR